MKMYITFKRRNVFLRLWWKLINPIKRKKPFDNWVKDGGKEDGDTRNKPLHSDRYEHKR